MKDKKYNFKIITLILLIFSTVAYAAATKKFFQPVEVQNLKLDTNTITSTNTNGDITIDANGTGDLILSDQVGVGGSPDASSLFQISSTALGAIPAPKMSEAQRDAVSSPTEGLQVFNTTSHALNFYNGSSWNEVGSGGGGGSSISGYAVDGISNPIDVTEDTIRYLRFGYNSSDIQYYYYRVKVPSSFKTGDRIKLSGLKFKVNSTDTSKTVLINTACYLLKTGDAVDSIANLPYNSPNLEVSVTATAQSLIAVGDVYLSDTNGQIDSRDPVADADLLIIMKRDLASESASVQADVDLVKDSVNISFNN